MTATYMSFWHGKVDRPSRSITLRQIAKVVCERHDITIRDLQGPLRWKEFSRARFEFCYLARQEGRWSSTTIGRWLGGRDHTTILHAANRYCELHGIPQEAKRPGWPNAYRGAAS